MHDKLSFDAMSSLEGILQGNDGSIGEMPKDSGTRGEVSLRNVAVTREGMQAAYTLAGAVDPRDGFVGNVGARDSEMFWRLAVK